MEPLILDHSAIAEYKDCPRRYFFHIVLGFNSKDTEIYFSFGTSYHKFREHLELSNGDFKYALLKAVTYWDKHQGDDPAPDTRFGFMTRLRLMQSCKVAFDSWTKEKALGKIVVLSVEQPFNVELKLGSGEYTSGRFDQIIRWNGKIWGRDFKTTSKDLKYYERGTTPNDQFTRYTYAESLLAGERIEGQLIEVLFNAKGPKKSPTIENTGPLIRSYPVSRTDFEIADWLNDELFWRKSIQISRETDTWPKNEKGCTFCKFHSVCKLGSEGSQKSKLLAEFKVQEWDNTKVGVED